VLSINTVAYGSVVIGGLALFAAGHPRQDAPLSPTTPGLAASRTAFAATPQSTPVQSTPVQSTPVQSASVESAPTAAASPVTAPPPTPVGPPAVPATPASSATGSVSGNGLTLTSLRVELPNSDRELPPGPGVETTQANCTACHSVGMIMNQPALSHATWETEVRKMIAVYKAPVSDEGAKAVIGYLDSIKGTR